MITILGCKKRYTYRGMDFEIRKYIEIWKKSVLNNNFQLSFGWGYDKLQDLFRKTTGEYGKYLFSTRHIRSRRLAKLRAKQVIDEFYNTDYLELINNQMKKLNKMTKNYNKLSKYLKYGEE